LRFPPFVPLLLWSSFLVRFLLHWLLWALGDRRTLRAGLFLPTHWPNVTPLPPGSLCIVA
jgi:hypothetical protein